MADSSLRLLLLLRHIPREPKFISTQKLLDTLVEMGHTVSLRTIQRDLQSLSIYFPLIQNTPQGRGKTGLGWAFAHDSQSLSFPVMGSAAALTLSMALQHLQQLLPASALHHLEPLQKEAENLLATHNHGQYQNWMDKVRSAPQHALQPPTINPEVVEPIYLGLLENRQLKASYRGKPDRIIHPYGLVQQGHTLYLLCRFYQFDDIRITALHRFDSVEVLDEAVRPFPEFDIDDYLDDGAMYWPLPERQTIELTLRAKANVTDLLRETPLATGQKITSDPHDPDWFIVQAKVLDNRQLRRWILSQNIGVEILEPASLREWITEIALEQALRYRR